MKSGISEKVLSEAKKTIEKYNMLKGVKKMVIAFSSGPDSVCLLDVLHTLFGKKIEFRIVYVNHGLRNQRNLREEENLTKNYASQYNIKYKIIPVKIKKKKVGIEAEAREQRYHALLNYMKRISAQRVCLGHNADDRVETFFMNLLRGSGTRGLKSIPAVRVPFIRPLINTKKTEILEYLKAKKLSYSMDETNKLLGYRRNLLRHKIIPELIKINPELHETIKREIELLAQDDEYLERQARRTYKQVAKKELNYVLLDINKILKYNPSVVKRVLMDVVKELLGSLDGFESKHFQEIIGLKDKESGKRISLPKELYAQREYGSIVVGSVRPVRERVLFIAPENEFVIFGDSIVKTRVVENLDLKKRKSNCEVFDLDRIEMPLYIRNKRNGDYIETKVGRKRLKKIYHECRIPLRRRNELMMLCDQKGILWILGVVRAFRGFISKNTKKILVVEFETAR